MDFTLKGTPYENLLTLFDGPTTIIFGEPNVKKMIPAIKKNRHLLLVGKNRIDFQKLFAAKRNLALCHIFL